jgi:hypothetical protein
MAMKTVVAKGYIRKVRGDKNTVITETLDDLEFKVCQVCRHWEQSGARLYCPCCLNGHGLKSEKDEKKDEA